MEITIENATKTITTLINKSVVEGALTINSVNSLNFLVQKADVLTKENEILKAKISELEKAK